MTTTKQMRHFQAVMTTGSLQEAAERLHITQPALTRSISKLEDELGVQLFERSRAGMAPTEFALGLAPRLRGLLLELEDIARDARLYSNLEVGSVCVGVGQAIREPLGRQCIVPFVAANPGVSLRLKEGTAPELIGALQARDIDMIIAGTASYREHKFLSVEPIQRVALQPMVRRGHPLTAMAGVSLSDLLVYPLAAPTALGARHPFLEKVGDARELLTPRYMCSDYAVLEELVAATDAWTVTLASVFHRTPSTGLQPLTVAGFDLSIELAVLELAQRSRAPAAQRFIDTVRNELAR
ncbi:MAG: LysR family transcriptional regulator [Pseudohaliea sp.]